MRMNTLLLISTMAGTAALVGCTQNQNERADAGVSKTTDAVGNVIREPLQSVTQGETITGTDESIRRYGPLTVYIPPGDTPPHGIVRQRVMAGEYGYAANGAPNGWYASENRRTDTDYVTASEPTTPTTVADDWTAWDNDYKVIYGPAALTPDNRALSFLHNKNTQEMRAGGLAAQKGSSQAVRDFGDMLASEHRAADEKVVNLAKSERAILMSSDKPRKDPLAKLQTLEGSEFDRAFVADMIAGHEKVIARLEKIRGESSANVRQLIDDTLPGLRTHLEKARALPN